MTGIMLPKVRTGATGEPVIFKKDSEDEELHLLMVDNHIPAGAKLC